MQIDARLTLAVLLAIFLESAAAFMWVGKTQERVSHVESTIEAQRPIAERLARVETEVIAVRTQLDRIERHLDEDRPDRGQAGRGQP
jgi:HAMP domain-containing protein